MSISTAHRAIRPGKCRLRTVFILQLLTASYMVFAFAQGTSGDVDRNGVIDSADLALLAQQLAGNSPTIRDGYFNTGDCDRNGLMDARDLSMLIQLQAKNIDRIWAGGDLWGLDPLLDAPSGGGLRFIPAGKFNQGSPTAESCRMSDELQFPHFLSENLAVMSNEVTRGMWARLKAYWDQDPDPARKLPADPSDPVYGSGQDYPVQNVTWCQAILFANLLSLRNGLTRCYYSDAAFTHPINAYNAYYDPDEHFPNPIYCNWAAGGYRLPTEAEWEYCCRAGTSSPFWVAEPAYSALNCGSPSPAGLYLELEDSAWFSANLTVNNGTSEVGRKSWNPWLLDDMHGNVWEWCWDIYGPYPTSAAADYRGLADDPGSDYYRVVRGGSWFTDARFCRSAFRMMQLIGSSTSFSSPDLGFRLVRRAEPCTPPVISKQPQGQMIGIGNKATLTVTATGTGPFHYFWYQGTNHYDSIPAPGAGDSPAYTTPELTASASYWVQVFNTCNYDDSHTALITVIGAGCLVAMDPIAGCMRFVPEGTFQQGTLPGDPCTGSVFTHTLTRNLAVMETEVTQKMWTDLSKMRWLPVHSSYFSGDLLPVEASWYGAVLFANQLSLQNGLNCCYYTDAALTIPIDQTNYYGNDQVYCDWDANGYRLPSEGEWENFCRAGTITPFSVLEPNFTGCDWDYKNHDLPGLESVAWFSYSDMSESSTHPVGLKGANPWNLKDMHGNLDEWCWDWYADYPSGHLTGYQGPADPTWGRVHRGGMFFSTPGDCRSATRNYSLPSGGPVQVSPGFRLIRTLD